MRNNRRFEQSGKAQRLRKHAVRAKKAPHGTLLSSRARGGERNARLPFTPPEDWYEPSDGEQGEYRFVVQPPGAGYRHIVSPDEVRQRLSDLPKSMIATLDVIQLSRMTRKKQSFPCYGMQWGSSLYLYPIEESLEEHFISPPRPSQLVEARMYGARWVEGASGSWRLIWNEKSIKDFFLNNVLIHELGHLLDDRNASYLDRERYAEWFATEYGYKPTRKGQGKCYRKVVRRHHAW